MARRISSVDPALALEYFSSGFFTYRNPLFAPFKGIGVNVVQFRDPVIDGANQELTDKYEWQRRPGFSKFCPTELNSTEIVNDFYSYRNLNGDVVPLFDSTQRLAAFNDLGINTLIVKNTTNQGYVSSIGNMVYFADGSAADLQKYDAGFNISAWGLAAPTVIPTSTGMGFWQPDKHFDLGDAIQDPNGNIEGVSAILIPTGAVEPPNAFENLALAGGVGVWAGTVGTSGVISQTLTSPGYTNYLFFYDFDLNIPTSATIIGVTVSVPEMVQGGTAVDHSVKLVVGGTPAGVDHADPMPWSTSGFRTTTYGSSTDDWGAGLTPTTANANGTSGFGVALSVAVTSTTLFDLVQSGTASTTGLGISSTVYSFPNPVTAGNTAVIAVCVFDENFDSITDNQGNTYTQVVSSNNGSFTEYVFVCSTIATGSLIVTVNCSNIKFNSFTCINAHEFSGIITASPVDVTASNNVPASPFNSGTVSVSPTSDLIFSYIYKGNGGATPPAGYTAATDTSFAAAGAIQQLSTAFLVPGVGGGFSPTWSTGNVGTTVAFKSANSATVSVGAGTPNTPIITIYYRLPSGVGPGFSGDNEPIWSTNLGGTVNDGGIAWTNYGPIETWFPLTNYPVPVVVLDLNGFLQLATSVPNPVQPWDAGATYAVGDTVSFGGGFWISLVDSNTGIAPSSGYTTSTTTGSTTITQPQWGIASNPIITGAIPPVWNTAIGSTTTDGSYVWKNIGQGSTLASFGYAYVYAYRTIYGHLSTSSPFSNNTGAIIGPLNGSIAEFSITSNIVTFFGSNNFIPGNVFQVTGLTFGTYLNEQSFTVLSAVDSEIFPLTEVAVSGSNVLTITAINNLIAGQMVTFTNVGTATFLNGVTVTVLPSGLSGTSFEANFTHASYGATADTGNVLLNGSWTASFVHADVGPTSDQGIAAPLISTITGVGTGSPLSNSVANITAVAITANIVTITASNNFQPGIWVTLDGLTNATFLNNQQVQVIAVDQPVGTQNTWFQVFFQNNNYVRATDTGTATFNAVEIYRTSDGGGTYLFDGAVTNPGQDLPWSFNDFVTDANLDILLTAPLSHQNDPPPGAPGSTIQNVGNVLCYWQGRIFMAVGNYVYMDAGPDCTNGIPEESWPPAYRFQFAGPVFNLVPTADGLGLEVWLADRVNAIFGGPETISFYPSDYLSNFGISNSNAIFRDGSTTGIFTTQRQYFELMGTSKNEIGERIADYLTDNFTANKTYVTMHRDGLDVGLFLSNGTNQVLRYGSNISAWSVPAFPSFGAGALRSIETSVGVYTLMLAKPMGGADNFLYARDLNSWGDGGDYGENNGMPYTACNIVLGSITMSQPGAALFPLQHVVGYFDAVGNLNNGAPSQPTIWIMPNEISADAGIGFIQLPEVLQEPPIGQNMPSASLLALRFPVNMMNSYLASQFLHHLQVRIEWEPENAPNTLKSLALMESQST